VPEVWLIIPEGNAKTTLFAGLALYHIEFRRFGSVPVAASSRDQVGIMYDQADGFITRSGLRGFKLHPGYRRIRHEESGGRIQVMAADDRTGDGTIPTLALLDELHRHNDLRLYRTWRGKLIKRGGQIGAISTRGEPGSEFESTLLRIRDQATDVSVNGSFTRAASAHLVLHEWAVPPAADADDVAVVKAANPLKAMTVEALAEKFASPTMTRHHWLRFACNRPTRDDDSWLGPDGELIWRDLEAKYAFVPGAPTWAGVDVGLKRDSTGVVAVQQDENGHFHARLRVWTPTKDEPVDITDVMKHIRDLDKEYDLKEVSFDPRFFDVAATMLGDEGLPMVEVPQSVERMTVICGTALELIKRGELHHDGDPQLANHVLNAVPRFNERGFTLQKSKSRGRIDGCIALVLAVDRCIRPEVEPMREFVSAWA
jgi:phage terminase large subunit-like protein